MKVSFVGAVGDVRELQARLRPSLAKLGRALGVEHCAVGVLLTDDAGITDYNRRFRGKAEATDVLSFPAGSGSTSDSGHYLGDLVVSLERAAEQARQHGHELAEEVEILLLHGLLHLLGHDHEQDQGEMRQLEQRLAVEVFGTARGLIARTESDPEGQPPGDAGD